MIDELERLAREAEVMPFDSGPQDVPWADRKAFTDACTADKVLKLVAVVRAAQAHIDSSNNDDSAGDTWAALRDALDALKGTK